MKAWQAGEPVVLGPTDKGWIETVLTNGDLIVRLESGALWYRPRRVRRRA